MEGRLVGLAGCRSRGGSAVRTVEALNASSLGEESPGSIDIRCRITPGGGNPRESATENEPPGEAPKGAKRGKGEKVR